MELTRGERIKHYAEEWYKIRIANGFQGNDKTDWARAEHIVDGEDKVALREKQLEYIHQHSRAKY